jgi:hypothetical protein
MLLLLSALALTGVEPTAELRTLSEPRQQAQSVVRIVRGAEIRFGSDRPPSADNELRHSNVRERDGSLRSAELIEFH